MTAFRIILMIFVLLILTIAANAVYVRKTADSLANLVDGLPDALSEDCLESVNELIYEWKRAEKLIGLSSGVEKTNRITELLACLYVCAEEKDSVSYECSRAVLKEAVLELSAMESLRPEDIF